MGNDVNGGEVQLYQISSLYERPAGSLLARRFFQKEVSSSGLKWEQRSIRSLSRRFADLRQPLFASQIPKLLNCRCRQDEFPSSRTIPATLWL